MAKSEVGEVEEISQDRFRMLYRKLMTIRRFEEKAR
jgi:TPP-dependent pyruvate/acetoin dehydrogenase alpha subunit